MDQELASKMKAKFNSKLGLGAGIQFVKEPAKNNTTTVTT